MSQVDWKRIGRLAWILVKITLGLFVLVMLPDWLRFIPKPVRVVGRGAGVGLSDCLWDCPATLGG